MSSLPATPPSRLRQMPVQPEREPGISWEHSRLFSRYMGDVARGKPALGQDEIVVESLFEQLTLRLSGVSQWPLHMALYLPRLGRIQVTARREYASWDITLLAEEASTSTWLTGVRQHTEERLSRTLGQPAQVHVVPVGATGC